MNQVDKAIKRVSEMEAIMDQALRIMDDAKESPETFLGFQSEIKKLADYYFSQDWKEDFALDEEGILPADLKRGVLSEDGIYDLLERNKELLIKYGKNSMTSKTKEKPLGMRIGENAFCIGYLAFALIAGIIFAIRTISTGNLFFRICAVMTLLLGGGDAFHLIPRIVINFRGEASDKEAQRKRDIWLGLGNLISSITMTVFYIFFFAALFVKHGKYDINSVMPEKFTLYLLLNVLALIRIILCLFPHNHWFSRNHETKWGLYRNIPFVIMGVITVLYLIMWYQEWLLAVLVTVSFVCYMIVVLGAGKKPMLGMMMIPKTICYIWMIALFL